MELALSWMNLSAHVNNKGILHNLNGSFGKGSINAVMGPSGCGKTSLMKCLNRKSRLVLNKDSKIFVSKSSEVNSGFIGQNQSQRLISGLTVAQSLTYGSQLKNSSVNGVNHKAVVKQVMAELLIEDIEENRIEKCSGGQLKRVSIGLELTAVNKPDFLFLDEPTTGLDSSSAQVIINCLRSVAVNYNKCVVCSIHQPNEEMFQMFDTIYVMAKGGHQLYSGSPQRLRNYLLDVDIEVNNNENEIPIEILLQYSSLGINSERVKRINNKCLEQTKREIEEYSEQNMDNVEGLKYCNKQFNIKDTLTLLRRQFRITFIAKRKYFIFRLTILILIDLIILIVYNPDNGKYDGCLTLNDVNMTCSQIMDDRTRLYSTQSYLSLGMFHIGISYIMIISPVYIEQYIVFMNEYRNGELANTTFEISFVIL